jgi:predicted metalloprotease with PDZ domain
MNTASVSAPRPNGPPIEWLDYPVIEDVQPGSPAETGGMRPGDKVLMMDGRDLVVSPPTKTFLAGDTVQFVVWRNDAEVPLTVVLGRWDPPQEAEGVTRICRPLTAAPSGH